MSIISLVAAIILLLIVVATVVAPLLMRENTGAHSFRDKQRERALAYYERVLRNIRDLDDDLATGKIMQAEYDIERERWMLRGVELLKMIKQLDSNQNIVEDVEADDAEIDAVIEQAMSDVQEKQVSQSVS